MLSIFNQNLCCSREITSPKSQKMESRLRPYHIIDFHFHFHFISKHTRVIEAISGLPWYRLPLQSQKNIAHILNRAQDGTVLRIGPFSRLDWETATDVRINDNLQICLFC